MKQDLPFDTVFTAFPLLNIAVLVGSMSYITFALMLTFFKRSRFLKKVLDGKITIKNYENYLSDESYAHFLIWARKRCIIQSVISAIFFVSSIGIFINFLTDIGTKADLYMFVFAFLLVASCHNLIKSIFAIIDAKKMNAEIKDNLSSDFFISHFSKIIKAEGVYFYFSIFFDIACIIIFGWTLYTELVLK
ncbi:hypothetical protein ACLEDP_16535 [Lonsdalea quercina]|uniref:hypothetical protein n=1 Tax=Lonsdalea quercina TaxID=71657 RepID=UPI003975F245